MHGPAVDNWRDLGLGGFATAILLFECLYMIRRRTSARPFGTAARALKVHVAAGSILWPVVIVHAGLSMPAGALGWWLQALVGVSVISGIAGLVLERRLPRQLIPVVRPETSQGREDAERLQRESAAAALGAPPALAAFYERDLVPVLAAPLRPWRISRHGSAQQAHLIDNLRHVARFLSDADREKAKTLEHALAVRFDLDTRRTLEWQLQAWLWVHVPTSLLLVALVLWHLYAVCAW